MTNLFEDDNNSSKFDPNKNYLEELVGTDKKFKSAEDLAKGKAIADEYITTLERQKDELTRDFLALREQRNSEATLKDLIDRLDQQQHASRDNTNNSNDVNNPPPIDLKQIEDLLSSKISERETARRQEENFNLVKAKLQERLGPNFASVLRQEIEGLGLDEETFNAMARTNPKVVLKTLGLDQQPQTENFQSPPRNNIRMNTDKAQKRTYSYYENMRKENPKLYYDPKTTVQMHNDAIELGDAFKDGSWHND